MKIFIIGIGMDGEKTLTSEALETIKSADILIGAERMLAPFAELNKKTFQSWKADEISCFLHENNFSTAAILMSGDCGFYSGAEKLTSALKGFETELICGISSPVYFCAKIKKPWQDMKLISLHGTDGNIIRNVCRNKYCFFLLGGDITPDLLCRKLCNYKMDSINVYIGENLAYENERIICGKASDFINLKTDKLTVVVTENSDCENGIASGIADEKFIRGIVPMTKSEVRSVVVSKLDIGSNDTCWDVGCGTGSISVEIALHCYNGKVYAVDKNDDAVQLASENSIKFGCDNIVAVSGNAPDCLNDLPAPDKVFIGGSCGKIKEILSVIYKKNLYAEVVITAVSLETLNEAVVALEEYKITLPEIVQISVTRTKKVGTHTMLSAENPVFVIKGVRI